MPNDSTSIIQQDDIALIAQIDRYNQAVDEYNAYGNYLKEKWKKKDPVQEMIDFLAKYK